MRAIEVAVGIDHLRLDPDAEVQAQSIHLFDHWAKTVQEFFIIDGPVTQASPVVIAAFEPAIANYKKLHADFLSDLSQAKLLFFIDVKRRGIPTVIKNRTKLIAKFLAQDMLGDVVVHPDRCAAHAVRREAENHFGC